MSSTQSKWLNAISRIWILSETMGKLFISLRFHLKEKLISISCGLMSITCDYTFFCVCVTSTFSPARREIFEYELHVIYRLLSRPSRSGGTDYSSIDYSYQLAIFLYPRATCHFVICLLPWKLSNCMESRENSPWSLCGRSSKCSTEGGWSNLALTSLLAVDFNYPYDLHLLLN